MAREDSMKNFGRLGCLGRSCRSGKEIVLGNTGGGNEPQERPQNGKRAFAPHIHGWISAASLTPATSGGNSPRNRSGTFREGLPYVTTQGRLGAC